MYGNYDPFLCSKTAQVVPSCGNPCFKQFVCNKSKQQCDLYLILISGSSKLQEANIEK